MFAEKSPTQSKKFWAYLLAELTWKPVLIVMILVMPSSLGTTTLIMTVILSTFFLEVGTILGQVWLDKYIRLAQIASAPLQKAANKASTTFGNVVEMLPSRGDDDGNTSEDFSSFDPRNMGKGALTKVLAAPDEIEDPEPLSDSEPPPEPEREEEPPGAMGSDDDEFGDEGEGFEGAREDEDAFGVEGGEDKS